MRVKTLIWWDVSARREQRNRRTDSIVRWSRMRVKKLKGLVRCGEREQVNLSVVTWSWMRVVGRSVM